MDKVANARQLVQENWKRLSRQTGLSRQDKRGRTAFIGQTRQDIWDITLRQDYWTGQIGQVGQTSRPGSKERTGHPGHDGERILFLKFQIFANIIEKGLEKRKLYINIITKSVW